MNNASHNEKVAILRILYEIMCVDGYKDPREMVYLSEVCTNLGMDMGVFDEVTNMSPLLALSVLRKMESTQREAFAVMMGKMIVADEEINYREVETYNVVAEFCSIEKPFDVSEYLSFVPK